MRTITLTDGVEREVVGVHGQSTFYQGVSRDSLLFLFAPETDLNELLRVFTPENCRQICIKDGKDSYIHENYTIRIEVGTGYQEQVLNGNVGQDMTQCAFVRMAQSTLAERQLLEQRETLDALVVAALEG